jgi:pimeloyl-ACP methyl ester carboxylesterase
MNSPVDKTGFAPVFKGQLYYEVSGSGLPVLLIHAGVADYTMWDAQFGLFSQSYRVIRYDTRGFGKSRTETTEFSNRQDILDLFCLLGIESACVIGISRGSMIAIDFTLEHPDYVSALILVAPGIGGYEYIPTNNEQTRHEIELFTHMDELWEKKAFEQLAELEVHAWADGPSQPVGRASPQIRNYIRKIVMANYIRQDGQATPQQLTPPAADRLTEIHIPTLILVGDYDSNATLAAADVLHKEIPKAQQIIFPATAHMIPLEQPAKFNQVVLDFLKQVL